MNTANSKPIRHTLQRTLLGAGLAAAAFAVMLSAGRARAEDVLVVRSSDLPPYKSVEAAFVEAMKASGKSTRVIDLDQGGKDAVKGEAGKAQLVFAVGPQAAKAVTEVVPGDRVLYAMVPSPGSAGLPGSVRGVPMFVGAKAQSRTIKKLLPGAKKVGILYDPAKSKDFAAEYEAAASSAGMTVVKEEVSSGKQVANSVRNLFGAVDVVWLIPDTTVISADTIKFMIQEANDKKIPMVGFSGALAKAGMILAIEAETEEMGRKAGEFARSALAGGKGVPASPEGAIYLNAKSAERLGISIPGDLQSAARKVFQ